ncbi:MAG: hypothetical protein AAGE93_09830 [Bacteroidota bacterium]
MQTGSRRFDRSNLLIRNGKLSKNIYPSKGDENMIYVTLSRLFSSYYVPVVSGEIYRITILKDHRFTTILASGTRTVRWYA